MMCLPIDDACAVSQQYAEVVASARDDMEQGAKDFSLGTFGGRTYRYMVIDGTPAIVIESEKADDIYPPDFLMED